MCMCVHDDAGSGHKGILRKARDFPKDYAIVYFFGSHDLYVPARCHDMSAYIVRLD